MRLSRTFCAARVTYLFCMYNTMTTCLYLGNLKLDIFDARVFSARLPCAQVYFHVAYGITVWE